VGDDDELIEYDFARVARKYATSWFILDVVSGVPFGVVDLILAYQGGVSQKNASAIKTTKALKLLRFLKLGRLFKVEKILSSLDRDTLDHLEDFFQDITTRSLVCVVNLLVCLAYVCHLLACGFVLVGRTSDQQGEDTWLAHEWKGPYEAKDTVDGPHVYSIYLAAFYFCLTTTTSIGYGDILCWNDSERLYVVFVEFMGAVAFAIFIANITAVISSMDMNKRKTLENLDVVSSFVSLRNFPEGLGRRIRRHFRHYYVRKSAIDESKIFSEMSTTLRKEVSGFLVQGLMSDVALFQAMSPVLWPRLLPLLRPLRFEPFEVVCVQHEECTEMYVILSGMAHGTTSAPSSAGQAGNLLPQKAAAASSAAAAAVVERRIVVGDAINELCVLGLWARCLETVVAEYDCVESYSLSEKDFAGLFTTESDLLALEEMKCHQVAQYRMDLSDESAPTEHGRPLYSCVYSALELGVVRAKGLAVADPTGSSDAACVVEMVDLETGDPPGRSSGPGRKADLLWSHTTAVVPWNLNPKWNESVKWRELDLPFHRLGVRVTVYDADFIGADTFLGEVTLKLSDLEALEALDQKATSKGQKPQKASEPPTPTAATAGNVGGAHRHGGMIARFSEGLRRLSSSDSQGAELVDVEGDSERAGNRGDQRDGLREGEAERWYQLEPHRVASSRKGSAVKAGGRNIKVSDSLRVTGAVQLRTLVKRAERDKPEEPRVHKTGEVPRGVPLAFTSGSTSGSLVRNPGRSGEPVSSAPTVTTSPLRRWS